MRNYVDGRNPFSLFWYANEEKVNQLLFQVVGRVITQIESSDGRGRKRFAKLNAKIGSLLSAIGIGEFGGEAGVELSQDSTKRQIEQVEFHHKFNALMDYLSRFERLPYLDAHRGLWLIPEDAKDASKWEGNEVTVDSHYEGIGVLFGAFLARRVVPPHDARADFSKELMRRPHNLWLLSTADDSTVRAEIPIVMSNIRFASQSAVARACCLGERPGTIQAFGVLSWTDDLVSCDPVCLQALK